MILYISSIIRVIPTVQAKVYPVLYKTLLVIFFWDMVYISFASTTGKTREGVRQKIEFNVAVLSYKTLNNRFCRGTLILVNLVTGSRQMV